MSGSPVKESSILQRGMSVDDQEGDIKDALDKQAGGVSPPLERDGVPIRQ